MAYGVQQEQSVLTVRAAVIMMARELAELLAAYSDLDRL